MINREDVPKRQGFAPVATFGAADGAANRLERLKTRRKLWLKVHLWLGLTVGAALVLIGLTGSVMVFWEEIDTWLNRDLRRVEIPASGTVDYRPLAEIQAAAQAALPPGAEGRQYYFPQGADGTFAYWYAMPEGSTHTLFVNPYTAQVTGSRMFYSSGNPFKHCFIGFFFKLHYALLLGKTGVVIVGILAVLLLISVLTGLLVWWPLTGKWRQAFTFKPRASVERFNFDLHKTTGIYSLLVLGAVLLSGVYLNLPEQFEWLVLRFSPATRLASASPPQSQPQPGIPPIGLDRAVAIVEAAYPGGRWNWLKAPDGANGVYEFSRVDVPGSRFWSESVLDVDQYSGKILQVRSPDTRLSVGETFLDWQWPLHSGKAFGWPGRILVFLTGLACPVLYVTGFIRWRQKRRASSSNKQRRG